MPVMGGDALVRELRAHPELEGIPIVVLTAKADDELRVDAPPRRGAGLPHQARRVRGAARTGRQLRHAEAGPRRAAGRALEPEPRPRDAGRRARRREPRQGRVPRRPLARAPDAAHADPQLVARCSGKGSSTPGDASAPSRRSSGTPGCRRGSSRTSSTCRARSPGKLRLNVRPIALDPGDPGGDRLGAAGGRGEGHLARGRARPEVGRRLGRSRAAPAGGVEPPLQRDQVHAARRPGRGAARAASGSTSQSTVSDDGAGIDAAVAAAALRPLLAGGQLDHPDARRPRSRAGGRPAPRRAARRHGARRERRARGGAPPSP